MTAFADTLNGLHIEDHGGEGEPLVLLHGLLFDGRQFAAQCEALRDHYRCITIDFPGQGRSAPSTIGYSTEALTQVMMAALERLAVGGPVHLAGLSMGGFTSMRIAARQPDLVRSLMLLNTSAGAHSRRKFPKQLALAGLARVAGTALPPITAGIEEEMFGDSFRHDAETLPMRRQWRARWAAADRGALVATLLGVMGRSDFRGQLGRIKVPTLVIGGSADASLPVAHSVQIYERIPGSQLVVVRGAGHSTPVEAPEAVTRALRAFLGGASRAAQS